MTTPEVPIPQKSPKKDIRIRSLGTVSKQELIYLAMTEWELPDGFGDHLRHMFPLARWDTDKKAEPFSETAVIVRRHQPSRKPAGE